MRGTITGMTRGIQSRCREEQRSGAKCRDTKVKEVLQDKETTNQDHVCARGEETLSHQVTSVDDFWGE